MSKPTCNCLGTIDEMHDVSPFVDILVAPNNRPYYEKDEKRTVGLNYCPQCGKPYSQTIKTIVECKLIQKMLVEGVGSPIVHNDGSCDGYSESQSDEPCVTCQNCNIRNGRDEDDIL